VDEGIADILVALWDVCDTVSCCQDDDGRASVTPATGQTATAEAKLLELGHNIVNEGGVLYFRLPS